MTAPAPLVRVRDLVKNYQALRPLRIQALNLQAGDRQALLGLDAQAAEVMVGLLTGALLPDSGDVELFGQSTRAVTESEAWLRLLDGVGIVTDRAVLIAQFSVAQNIAMPFTLEIDPIAPATRPLVEALAAEVGLANGDLDVRVAESAPGVQARVRLARALALNPAVLLAEHPTATLPREGVAALAADMARVAAARSLALLVLTADELFARKLGGDLLHHEPATGVLRRPRSWRTLFR